MKWPDNDRNMLKTEITNPVPIFVNYEWAGGFSWGSAQARSPLAVDQTVHS